MFCFEIKYLLMFCFEMDIQDFILVYLFLIMKSLLNSNQVPNFQI